MINDDLHRQCIVEVHPIGELLVAGEGGDVGVLEVCDIVCQVLGHRLQAGIVDAVETIASRRDAVGEQTMPCPMVDVRGGRAKHPRCKSRRNLCAHFDIALSIAPRCAHKIRGSIA